MTSIQQQSSPKDNNSIRPLTLDGFDIDFKRNNNQKPEKVDNRNLDRSDANPGDCDVLGLDTTFEKVLDFTYDRGNKEEINMDNDIGIINTCLEICNKRGKSCLAVTLNNQRGGRQSCFALDNSAGVDGTEPTASTGTFYFEKICVRKCQVIIIMIEL